MEKRLIKTTKENKAQIIDEMSAFLYVLKKEQIIGENVHLTFVRDAKIDDELARLEDEYNSYKIPSIWPLVILMVITFILLTLLLIFVLMFKNSTDKDAYFIGFGVPSALSFIALSGYYYFRTFRSITRRN